MARTTKLGERLCPKCKEPIQADASICKHCGTTFTDDEVAAAKASAKKSRRNVGFGCLSLVLLLGFCGYVVGESKNDKPHQTAEQPSGQKSDAKPSLTLSPDEFATRFNALAREADKSWRIDKIDVGKNSFKYMLSDHLAFIGDVNDAGKLGGLVFMGTGDGSITSGTDVFMAMAITYCAVSDISNLKECGPPMLDLFKGFKDGGEPNSAIINNIKFSYSRNEITGNVLIVSPI